MKTFVIFSVFVVFALIQSSRCGEHHQTLKEIDRLVTLNNRAERGRLLSLFKRLFATFRKLYKRSYHDPNESGGRFRNFVKAVKMILSINKSGLDFEAEMNKFTDMSDDEKDSNTGVNASQFLIFEERFAQDGIDYEELAKRAPESIDWIKSGKTLKPLDQGKCASCWAMATVGVVESRYAITTGTLKRFSVQELLECAYEYTGRDPGCKGGWFTKSYAYLKKGNHLTLDSNLPYSGVDGKCTAESMPNGLKAATMVEWKSISKPSFEQMVVLLQDGPISVAIKAQGDFFQYGTGIYHNPKCSISINHGLVAVGYAPGYIILRNSWGKDWGQGGYVYFTRTNGNVCGIGRYALYGKFALNNQKDDDPTEIPESAGGICRDEEVENCSEYGLIGCSDPLTSNFMKTNCRNTCKICSAVVEEGECPPATVMCDGECIHPHMCAGHSLLE